MTCFFKDNGNIHLIAGRRLFLRVMRGLGEEPGSRPITCEAFRHCEKKGKKEMKSVSFRDSGFAGCDMSLGSTED